MKNFNREAIQRMFDGRKGGGGGGTNNADLAGYATQMWVNQNYVSIEFFNRLFSIHGHDPEDESTPLTDISVLPNDMDSIVDSIESMVGFYTEEYLSALGLNPDSGSGNATTLYELLDVKPNSDVSPSRVYGLEGTSADNGKVLTYSTTYGKWIAAANGAGSGSVTSIDMTVPTGFSVSGAPITTYGTLAVTFGGSIAKNKVLASPANATGSPDWRTLVASDIPDLSATYASASDVTTLQGYFDNLGNANSANKLAVYSKTAWGQTYWTSGGVPDNISGDMTSVGDITASSNGTKDIKGFRCLEMYGAASSNFGGYIDFHYNNDSGDYTSRIIEDASGVLKINNTIWATLSGDVGVGTSTTYTKLTVNGGVKTTKLYLYKPNAANDTNAVYFEYDSANAGVHLVGAGFYSNSYLSALGLNSNGGGGSITLYEPLNGINNAGLSAPTSSASGQTVVWNGSAWTYSINTTLRAGAIATTGGASIYGNVESSVGDFVASAGHGFKITGGESDEVLRADGTKSKLMTINGNSLFGEGDIVISGGGTGGSSYLTMINKSTFNFWDDINHVTINRMQGVNTGAPSGFPYGYLFNFSWNGQNSWSGQLYYTVSDFGSEILTRGYWANRGWTEWRKFWNESNDGSGSGLDADLLDGIHASDLFSLFGADNEKLSITIGGTNKQYQVPSICSLGVNNEVDSSSTVPSVKFEGAKFGTSKGLYLTEWYPTLPTSKYYNVINIIGNGAGQILAEWCNNYTTGHLYYRSHRDIVNSGGWTPWKTIAFTDDDITGNANTATLPKYFDYAQTNNNWPNVTDFPLVVAWDKSGGEIAFLSNGNGKLCVAVDGFFYQGIDMGHGNSRVADLYDLQSYYTKTAADAAFVTAVGTSGDSLSWTKNGTASTLTVPFATRSETYTLKDKASTDTFDFWEGTANRFSAYSMRGVENGCPIFGDRKYTHGYLYNYAWQSGNSTWSGQVYFTVSDYGSEIMTRGYWFNNGWTAWRRFWNSENDGSGSGLDADLLDGQHASAFATASSVTTLQGYFDSSGAANSAVILKTSRSLWGQSFNGSSDVTGRIIISTTTGSHGNYDEGIRINSAFGSPLIHFGGTGEQGTGANQWSIGLHDTRTYWALTYNKWTNYIITSDTSGNVGIGKNNPSQKLDVNGNVNINGTLTGCTSIDSLLYFDTTNSGVGIGYSSVAEWNRSFKLRINGDMQASHIEAQSFGGEKTDTWSEPDDSSKTHIWYGWQQSPNNNTVFHGTFSDYYGMTFHTSQGWMCLTSAGNVGIGTTSPSEKLHVVGNILASGSTANGTYIQIGDIRIVYDNAATNGNNALKVVKSDGTAANFYATGAVSALGANTSSGGAGDYIPLSGSTAITGSLVPATNNTYDLGSSTKAWGTIYANSIAGNASLSVQGISCTTFSTSARAVISSGAKFYSIYIESDSSGNVSSSHSGEINRDSADVHLQYASGTGGVTMCRQGFRFTTSTDGGGNNLSTISTSNRSLRIELGTATLNPYISKPWNEGSDIRRKDIIANVSASIESIADAPIFNFRYKGDLAECVNLGTSAQYWRNVFPCGVTEMGDGYLAMSYGSIALAAAVVTARKVQNHEDRIRELEERLSLSEAENKALREEIELLKAA